MKAITMFCVCACLMIAQVRAAVAICESGADKVVFVHGEDKESVNEGCYLSTEEYKTIYAGALGTKVTVVFATGVTKSLPIPEYSKLREDKNVGMCTDAKNTGLIADIAKNPSDKCLSEKAYTIKDPLTTKKASVGRLVL